MIDKIKRKLAHSSSFQNDKNREAAVLIPLINVSGELHILFEVRSHKLNTGPSEICFPGGKIELFETPESAALRETSEELNININDLELFDAINILHTPFNLVIHPFVGQINNNTIESIQPNIHEVEKIFTVPLSYLLLQQEQSYNIKTYFDIPTNFPYHMIQNGENYNWKSGSYEVLFYQYEDYIIWGVTAKILRTFLTIISD